MKVLLSIFECNPYRGSDSYVGWAYVLNMVQINEVFALTRFENKKDIENYCHQNAVPNLDNIHFYYIERSKFWGIYLHKINRYLGFWGSYFEWQRRAYRCAKEICKTQTIAICHHITIADFRCTGKLWMLSDILGIPFIFGPVGGAGNSKLFEKIYTGT